MRSLAGRRANTARVSGLGTARRIKALVAIGYTQADIAERIGWSPAHLSKLLDEDGMVSASTARTIDALYRQLCMTPGPSDRARQRAKKLGWAPPLAWDDIDDPAETPNIGAERRVSFAERYTEMRELGLANHEIAARMGIHPESLERQLHRYGLKNGRPDRIRGLAE